MASALEPARHSTLQAPARDTLAVVRIGPRCTTDSAAAAIGRPPLPGGWA